MRSRTKTYVALKSAQDRSVKIVYLHLAHRDTAPEEGYCTRRERTTNTGKIHSDITVIVHPHAAQLRPLRIDLPMQHNPLPADEKL